MDNMTKPSVAYTYPPSYQEKFNDVQANLLSFNRYLVLGLSGFILVAFITVLVGLGTKRPKWWYSTLTRWFNITDHDTTSNLLVIASQSNGRAQRQRDTSNNPLAIRLDAWRTFQEEKHVPPPRISELCHLRYMPPAMAPAARDDHTRDSSAAKSTLSSGVV
ncbi:hypothetical protein H310_13390 [Aphanomyces invadans]|uniref:Uncharacterized protein n=1 Tax=Aphanomyces invadans TaxID=157072 RepID=A0A024TEA5_9STRA|nr:hypothetical protein H310_13390 [Aphanomyces invadans]ETV92349.1 hypothetical protein H310_13390 [Aphanomyces invadans]|eukprot:XP_008879100.1 hypothetical protein H310_13390 [Aphanomyces invadans]